MKFLNNKTVLSVAIVCPLPASMVNEKTFKKTLTDMEKNWPYFNSTMDLLDMVLSKVDPEISKIYEKYTL